MNSDDWWWLFSALHVVRPMIISGGWDSAVLVWRVTCRLSWYHIVIADILLWRSCTSILPLQFNFSLQLTQGLPGRFAFAFAFFVSGERRSTDAQACHSRGLDFKVKKYFPQSQPNECQGGCLWGTSGSWGCSRSSDEVADWWRRRGDLILYLLQLSFVSSNTWWSSNITIHDSFGGDHRTDGPKIS